MSSTKAIEELQAEADYYHDRVALLRAKLYRWVSVPARACKSLEREPERAQRRLRDARLSAGP